LEEVTKVKYGLETNLPSDLMAIDIKEALYHFGMITGQVTNDEFWAIYLQFLHRKITAHKTNTYAKY
jgi:tRNA U34 5-carboxymethylaminomethyl modifying GTPase MnmE/TrmE